MDDRVESFELIPAISLRDLYGRSQYYSEGDLENLEGSMARLQVINNGPVDQPPRLTSLTLSPSSVDITNAGQAVVVRVEADDDFDALTEIKVQAFLGEFSLYLTLDNYSQISRGVYEKVWEIPPYYPAGTFPLTVFLNDTSRYSTTYPSSENPFPEGVDTDITIVNDGLVDSELPFISKISFFPSTVDVTEGSQDVRVVIEAGDDTEVASLGLGLFGEDTRLNRIVDDFGSPVSGDVRSGVYEATISLSSHQEADVLIPRITISDSVGNFRTYRDEDSESPLPGGDDSVLAVVNSGSGSPDPVLPLVSATLSSTTIDVSEQAGTVGFRIEVGEEFYQNSSIQLSVSAGPTFISHYMESYSNRIPGIFEGELVFPEITAPGTYSLNLIVWHDFQSFTYGESGLSFPEGSDTEITVINEGLADLNPPEITGIVISPETIDVAAGAKMVAMEISATDDVGLESLSITFEHVGGYDSLPSLRLSADDRISGDAKSGVYAAEVLVPGHTGSKTYEINVSGSDFAGRGFRYPEYGAERNPGFDNQFFVVNSGKVDEPPVLTGLSITPSEVDVSSGSQTVTVRIEAKDDFSEISSIDVNIDDLIGGGTDAFSDEGLRFSRLEPGVFEASFEVYRFTPPGVYKVSGNIRAGDANTYFGNNDDFTGALLPELRVINRNAYDLLPPEIIAVDFSKSSVDVTNGDAEFVVRVEVIDDYEVETLDFSLLGAGSNHGRVIYLSESPISGDGRTGVYEGVFTVPENTSPGIARCTIEVTDIAGNTERYSWPTSSLEAQGKTPLLEIINNNENGGVPTLLNLTFDPPLFDLSEGQKEVVVRVEVGGELGETPIVAGNSYLPGRVFSFYLTEDDLVGPGIFERVVIVPDTLSPGDFPLMVTIYNGVSSVTYGPYREMQIPFSITDSIVIINDNHVDITAPEITGYSFSPQVVDVSSSSARVTLRMECREQSQLAAIFASLGDSEFNPDPYWEDLSFDPINGRISRDGENQVFETEFIVPRGAAPGIFIPNIRAYDEAGNSGLNFRYGDDVPIDSALRIVNSSLVSSGPRLRNVILSGSPLDVTTGPQMLGVSLEIEDRFSELERVVLRAWPLAPLEFSPVSRSSDGTVRLSEDWEIPPYLFSGTYDIEVEIVTYSGEVISFGGLSPEIPLPLDSDKRFAITNEGAVDNAVPEITDLIFSPNPIARDRLPARVSVMVAINDPLSGFLSGSLGFAPLNFDSLNLGETEFGSEDLIAGDQFSGVYEYTVDIDWLPADDRMNADINLRDRGQMIAYLNPGSFVYPEDLEQLMIVDSYDDSYDAWIAMHPDIPRVVTSPIADADGDGFANGIEFYLGMDPMADSNGTELVPEIVIVDGQFGLQVPVSESNLVMDGRSVNAVPKAQWSTGGVHWTDIETPEVSDGTLTFLSPMDGEEVKLMRFVVEFLPLSEE